MGEKTLRALIVDDSEDDVLILVHHLKKNGYDPLYEQVQTAAEMKKALLEKPWDIILCDYKMPEFSGPLAIELLNETKLDIPLIIVSGVINDVMAVECMRLGARDYVLKTNLSRLGPAIARELEEAKVRKNKKKIEEKLHREEELFRAIAEQSSDIIVLADRQGKIIYENPAVTNFLGLKPEERFGKNILENVHPDDIGIIRASFDALISDKDTPVQEFEVRIRHTDGSWHTFEIMARNITRENLVNTVVVNLHDITERKRAEEEVRESESRFRTIYNSTSDGILIAGADDRKFVMANEKICEMLGYDREELLGLSLDDIHPKESVEYVAGQFKKISNKEIYVTRNIPVMKKDKTVFFADIGGSDIKIDGKYCLIGVFRDMTERNKYEEDILQSEANFRLLSDNAPDAIFIRTGPSFAYVNSAALKLFGAESPEQLIGKPLMERIHPDDRESTMERMRILDEGKQPLPIFEQKYLKLDGTVIEVEVNAVPFRYENTDGSLVFIRDITERKRTEETLLFIKKAVESSSDAIGLSDPQARHFYHNKAFTDMFEYTPEELGALGGGSVVYCDKNLAREVFNTIMKGGSWSGEAEMVSKSGRKFIVSLRADAITDETGKLIGLIGVNTDITEQKKAQENLRINEERYRMAETIGHVGNWEYNLQTTKFWGSSEAKRIYGFAPDASDFTTDEVENCIPERERVHQALVDLIEAGKPYNLEFEIHPKNSSEPTIISSVAELKRDEHGNPLLITGVIQDITKRKKAEEELKSWKRRYDLIVTSSGQVAYDFNVRTGEIIWGESIADVLGYPPEEIRGGYAQWEDLLHPDDRQKTVTMLEEAEKACSYWDAQYRMRHREGHYIWIRDRGFFVPDSEGKACVQLGMLEDVTERKLADERILLSEEKFRAIFESNSAAIALINPDTTIAMVNDAYCEISGYTREEAVGLSWSTQIASYDLERLKDYNRQRILDPRKAPNLYEFDFYMKNGAVRHVMIYVAVMPGSKQIIAVFNDITEKKEQEEKLKKTLESLRKAFSSIIQVMVSAVEMKDPYTAGHQVRTADLARAIAEEMGLDRDRIDGIRMAGTIHDIGKLSIPAEILSKPTKLTNVEFSLIKGHPESGYDMLKDVESPWPLAEIVYQHHERINGTGYPRGLKGDEILLEARIMAVADVVEAMASHRPYRAALGTETALEEIEKNRGILYDEAVTDACLRLFRQKGYELKQVL